MANERAKRTGPGTAPLLPRRLMSRGKSSQRRRRERGSADALWTTPVAPALLSEGGGGAAGLADAFALWFYSAASVDIGQLKKARARMRECTKNSASLLSVCSHREALAGQLESRLGPGGTKVRGLTRPKGPWSCRGRGWLTRDDGSRWDLGRPTALPLGRVMKMDAGASIRVDQLNRIHNDEAPCFTPLICMHACPATGSEKFNPHMRRATSLYGIL